ncbi:histidine kinase [Paenibacillus sp. VTT E-133280]|uniref:helix-turn-helix transcriptional regulator n=1 Tax=Paenibacillus TaxID=44249 RepID=UPI000BA0C0C5|nr:MULTISPECIES: hybrid sensor histidine kinase/response regulator transcription factor [unclassified Paenibacillus]MDH6372700.1 DNA-binding NarL/FixJ family response regulator/signal transduction histidine kinase [Paenibacillus sp. PastF-3]OZQ70548.1 histidine kinase [Paenibacillus sp. VTT E-133280]
MFNLVKQWFWYDWLVLLFRICFSTSLLITMCYLSDNFTIPFWIAFVWGLIAFSVPWFCLQLHYKYYLIAEILLSGGLCLYLAALFPESYVTFLPTAFMIASNSAQKSYRWSAPITVILIPILLSRLSQQVDAVSMILNIGLVYTLGFAFHLLMVNHKQSGIIKDQNAVLEQYISQVERMTLLEERDRLSKDLHDTVGHSYTSILMGLETLRTEVNTSDGAQKIDALLKLTRHGLDDVRRYLHQVGSSQDSLTLIQSLQKLVDDFQTFSKVKIRLRTFGEAYTVSKQAQMTLYRCLQESITNAVRHGQASEIVISLHYEEKLIRLDVQDNGLGAEDLTAGFGLNAMKERASNLQGQVYVYSKLGEGTLVTCSLPRLEEIQEETVRLLLVDDQPYIRDSLRIILEQEPDFEIIGLAENGEQAVSFCEQDQPHVVLMDLNMPDMDGAEATKLIKQKWPGVRVLILTTFQETDLAVEALQNGADGYLLKSTEPQELFEGIRLVHRGVKMITPAITNVLIDHYEMHPTSEAQTEQSNEYGLTPRELEILECLSKGMRYKSIAAKLYLSDGTVRNYASTIYAKLGVRNREEAVEKAFGTLE